MDIYSGNINMTNFYLYIYKLSYKKKKAITNLKGIFLNLIIQNL